MNPAVHTLPGEPGYVSLETIVYQSISFCQKLVLVNGTRMSVGNPNDHAERPSDTRSHRMNLRSLSTPPLGLLYLPNNYPIYRMTASDTF